MNLDKVNKNIEINDSYQIPKIIHYCWFGNNKKPECILKCIESWKKFCPDYEIKEWNESNFDVNMFNYTKEAYEVKKWAFVSDVARLWIIYEYGGIYMDTDVEILNNIDYLLNNECFLFFQSERHIATGLGFGAVKNNKIIKAMLDDYNSKHFLIDTGKFDTTACPILNTIVLKRELPKLELDGNSQNFGGIHLLSCGEYNKTMYHYGAQSWTDEPNFNFKKRDWKDTKLKQFLRKTTRMNFIETHTPKKVSKAYMFIAYDLLENGILYYFKKIIKKITKK